MAEEETKEDVKEESEDGAKAKKSPMVMIIIAVVVILLALIGAVVAILLSGGEEEVRSAPQAQESSVEGGAPKSKKSYTGGATKAFTELGPMFPLDSFTVNLLSESGRRYLKVEMNLELSGEEVAVELDSRQAAIRDIIIRMLSSKSLEEISTVKGKEKLKDQILDQLNMRLKDGSVNNIYFTNFVIQ